MPPRDDLSRESLVERVTPGSRRLKVAQRSLAMVIRARCR